MKSWNYCPDKADHSSIGHNAGLLSFVTQLLHFYRLNSCNSPEYWSVFSDILQGYIFYSDKTFHRC